jgi:hypothetical protein
MAEPRVGETLRSHRLLVSTCSLAAVLETVLVWAFAPAPSLGLATQAAAPPPFGVFHDLRWIVVYHETWLGFAFELLAFLVFRTALTALCLRAAWPHDLPAEPWAVTVRRSALFTVIAGALLAPWAGLMFALAVVSLSWLFFVAVPVVLLLAMLVHGGAVTNSWWWRTLSWRSVGWVLLAFAALTVFGSVLTTCPWWARVPVAAAAGVVNAWLWLRVVDSVLHRRRTPRRFPVAPMGVFGVLALVVVGTAVGFAVAQHPLPRLLTPAAAAAEWRPSTLAATGTPLVVVTGFNTKWDGRASQYVRVDLPQWRFSYRGTNGDAPLPYTAVDTHRALPELARELRHQVDVYHEKTGRKLTIVAESEGALLAKTYLAATPHAPVRNLVLLSPLVEPGRVYYPANGQEGWGAAGAAAMRGFAWALHGLSPVDVTPDTPFFRSIVDDAPALRGLISCPLPHVHEVAVLPLDTGVSASAPRPLDIPYVVVPAFHGGMLDDETTARVVTDVIMGHPVPMDDGWSLAEEVISAGASAWQVPQLTTGLNSAWSGDPNPDNCPAIRAHLRGELS